DQCLVDRSVKTVPDDDIGSRDLERPVHDLTLVVLRVEIDPAMRILFDDFRQLSNQRQRLALIIFSLKRMVGPAWNRGCQQTHSQQKNRYLFHRKTSKSLTHGLTNDTKPDIAETQRRAVIAISSRHSDKSCGVIPCAPSHNRQPTDESA